MQVSRLISVNFAHLSWNTQGLLSPHSGRPDTANSMMIHVYVLDFKVQTLAKHDSTTRSLTAIPRVASLKSIAQTVPRWRRHRAKTSVGLSWPTSLEIKRVSDVLLVGFDRCFLIAGSVSQALGTAIQVCGRPEEKVLWSEQILLTFLSLNLHPHFNEIQQFPSPPAWDHREM